jgi:hypothetical protein
MKIDYGTELAVRLLRKIDMDGLVHLLVEKESQLAQELSDKIAFKIQDNDIVRTESELMQEELEPITHPTEYDESDDIEANKRITGEE